VKAIGNAIATAVIATGLLAAGLVLIGLVAAAPAAAQQVRFATVDVYLDTNAPLAAWQFELTEANGLMTVVGVENGQSQAFGDAPYYDLEAVSRGGADRIVVADFSLAGESSLPRGTTRIATVHVELTGSAEPDYRVRLIAAGDAAGRAIEAAISLQAQNGR